jgi:hypothetical protein
LSVGYVLTWHLRSAMEYKYLLSHPTGQDSCRQPVTLIVAEQHSLYYCSLKDLVARMKRMAYNPAPVRQVLIPKEGKPGATRPLAIGNFEDKLVQKMIRRKSRINACFATSPACSKRVYWRTVS